MLSGPIGKHSQYWQLFLNKWRQYLIEKYLVAAINILLLEMSAEATLRKVLTNVC